MAPRCASSLDGERDALLGTYFSPYHADLARLVRERLTTDDRCLLLDCHSFATEPLASEPDQTPDRPDVCIGTDAFHTPPALADAIVERTCCGGLGRRGGSTIRGTIVPMSRTSSTGAWPR